MTSMLLLATDIPRTVSWGPQVAIVMILCNIAAIAIGKSGIEQPSAGPALPSPEFFGGFGLPAVLATTSLGHILGVLMILVLAGVGLL